MTRHSWGNFPNRALPSHALLFEPGARVQFCVDDNRGIPCGVTGTVVRGRGFGQVVVRLEGGRELTVNAIDLQLIPAVQQP